MFVVVAVLVLAVVGRIRRGTSVFYLNVGVAEVRGCVDFLARAKHCWTKTVVGGRAASVVAGVGVHRCRWSMPPAAADVGGARRQRRTGGVTPRRASVRSGRRRRGERRTWPAGIL